MSSLASPFYGSVRFTGRRRCNLPLYIFIPTFLNRNMKVSKLLAMKNLQSNIYVSIGMPSGFVLKKLVVDSITELYLFSKEGPSCSIQI